MQGDVHRWLSHENMFSQENPDFRKLNKCYQFNTLPPYNIRQMKSSLCENPDLDTMVPVCCAPLIRATRILFFEFIAAGILTFATMVSYGPGKEALAGSPLQCAYISVAMFYVFVFCGQVSGGHGNPIISIALVFTKGSNVTPLNLIIYILAQYIGAIVGAAVAYGTLNQYGFPFPLPFNEGVAFALELFGSFFFVILYLLVMTATKMEHNFWSYFLVPAAFYIAKMLTYQYVGLNPAAVLANQLFAGIKINDFLTLSVYWIYIVAPVVGTIVASVIFNFFALPVYRASKSKN